MNFNNEKSRLIMEIMMIIPAIQCRISAEIDDKSLERSPFRPRMGCCRNHQESLKKRIRQK